jgi:hypothetical protein
MNLFRAAMSIAVLGTALTVLPQAAPAYSGEPAATPSAVTAEYRNPKAGHPAPSLVRWRHHPRGHRYHRARQHRPYYRHHYRHHRWS